jgi:hypothetical protein
LEILVKGGAQLRILEFIEALGILGNDFVPALAELLFNDLVAAIILSVASETVKEMVYVHG